MAGLDRVAAVYRLLERVRQAEAMSASAGVAEVDRNLDALAVRQTLAREDARAGVEDPVTRTSSETCLAAVQIIGSRLHTLRGTRAQEQERALQELAESRLRVKQVEETILSAQREEDALESKRAQAEADERFLSQRFRSRR